MFNFQSNYQIVFQSGCIFPLAKFESSVCFTSLPVLGIAGLFNFSILVRHEWSLTQAHIYPPPNIFWNHHSHPTPPLLPICPDLLSVPPMLWAPFLEFHPLVISITGPFSSFGSRASVTPQRSFLSTLSIGVFNIFYHITLFLSL